MRLLRKILKGVSLTAAMFVFQACYGIEPDYCYDRMTFRVVSDKDHEPLPDIKVSSQWQSNQDYEYDWVLGGYTDSAGIADIGVTNYICQDTNVNFRFEDEQSQYEMLDTVFNTGLTDTIDIVLRRVQ
ncbi:MAG: hypothetical protein IJ524_07840 [Bacteroidales bacterium]|nr:hypothetical protein [Bacteroidales bacterium]